MVQRNLDKGYVTPVRRKKVVKREIIPDSKYNDRVIAKFINMIMKKGKKSLAESMFYNMFDIISDKVKDDPVGIFKKAIDNAKPLIEVKSRRVGGATYQVPIDVKQERRISLAIRWLIQFAKNRTGKSMSEKLAAEVIDAANNRGSTIKKREDVHKMAEANRAFAHYRW